MGVSTTHTSARMCKKNVAKRKIRLRKQNVSNKLRRTYRGGASRDPIKRRKRGQKQNVRIKQKEG